MLEEVSVFEYLGSMITSNRYMYIDGNITNNVMKATNIHYTNMFLEKE